MDKICAICQEVYNKYTYMETKCNHRFHSECWDKLENDKKYMKNCPLCRQVTTIKYYPCHSKIKYEQQIETLSSYIHTEYDKYQTLTNSDDSECCELADLSIDYIIKNAKLIIKCGDKIKKYTPNNHKKEEFVISDDEFVEND